MTARTTVLNWDVEEVLQRRDCPVRNESVDVIVTSPPYKRREGQSPKLMEALGRLASKVLKPSGRMFLDLGQLREDYAMPFWACDSVAGPGLVQGQTIIWIKSIVMDGKQRGHFQAITSDRVLNYCFEFLFMFYKPPEPNLDKLAVGVPYADKSNLRRGTRGKHGDVHCAGDVWFVPYKTTGNKRKKKHAYEYPEALVERCLKVSGIKPGATVLDPFCGSGTTLVVAERMGFNAVGIDRNEGALATTRSRCSAESR